MKPFYQNSLTTIYTGHCLDVLRGLPYCSVQCCVTSPPYWGLRDYGVDGQIGLEKTPEEYVANMVEVFREVRRVLRDDGCVWLNLGDTYCNAGSRNNGTGLDGKRRGGMSNTDGTWSDAREQHGDMRHRLKGCGIKHKDRCMIPARVALALQADEWWLRDEIVWAKPSPMPSSVRDRTTSAHEMVYLLAKRARYFYDADAVREPHKASSLNRYNYGHSSRGAADGHVSGNEGCMAHCGKMWDHVQPSGANKRSVWTIASTPYREAHFATFPPAFIEPMILAGTSEQGCCPHCGAPWRRVVERVKTFQSGSGRSGNPIVGKNGTHCQGGGDTGDVRKGPCLHTTTTGWEPTCDCEPADPVPCCVLDPFLGSGTTAQVCRWLGRRCIGIELNDEYAEMAIKRTNKPRQAPARPEDAPGQMRLFGDRP